MPDRDPGSPRPEGNGGIVGLVKSAALELGSSGITGNAVIPGLDDTTLTRHEDRYAQAISSSGGTPTGDVDSDDQTVREGRAATPPLGVPWISPGDVAPLVVFLASYRAWMVSGTSFAATAEDSANVSA